MLGNKNGIAGFTFRPSDRHAECMVIDLADREDPIGGCASIPRASLLDLAASCSQRLGERDLSIKPQGIHAWQDDSGASPQ